MDELLRILSLNGISIKAINGQLEVSDPQKKISPEIINSIKSNKEELLDLLAGFEDKKVTDKIFPQEEKEYYRLSAAQNRLYFLHELDKSSIAYNVTQSYKLYGELDIDRVNHVMKKLIVRHESLRTVIISKNNEPWQRILGEIEFKIEYFKASEKEDVDAICKKIVRPFDLYNAPLFRFGIVEITKTVFVLVVDIHHIITDGISSSIMVSDFIKFYNNENLIPIKVRYKDYSEWQIGKEQQKSIQKQKKWWLETFKEEIPTLNLPTDFNRPNIMTYEGETLDFGLDKAISQKLAKIADEEQVSLFMLLFSLFNILLSKLTNTQDIIIGTPVVGRRHVDLEETIGMFVNTVVLRNFPQEKLNFVSFLKQVKSNLLNSFDNQDFQFEDLISELKVNRDKSRHPLFNVMFALNNINTKKLAIPQLVVEQIDWKHNSTKFDLNLECYKVEDELKFSFFYYSKIFEKSTIESFIKYYKNIINSIITHRNITLCDIEILTKEEKQQLLYEFNDNETSYPKEKTIVQIFEDQVKMTPDNLALVCDELVVTYKELNEKSNQLAWNLIEKGVKAETIVGIHVGRSTEMIVSILGVLKAGGCYLPIDVIYPRERKNYMFEDSQMEMIIVDSDDLKELNSVQQLNIKDESSYLEKVENPCGQSSPNNMAYIIYTSGSTGNPKGVIICHENVVNYITWASRTYKKNDNLNFPLYSSISFDLTVTSIFTPLMNGYLIKIFPSHDSISAIFKILKDQDIGVVKLTPAHLKMLVEEDLSKCNIHTFVVGGEELETSLASKIDTSSHSNITIYNEYGPTESTVGCMIYKYDITKDKNKSVSIGKGAANHKIFILDDSQKLVPIGVYGELYISGNGLARGYLNSNELTAKKFIDHPFDEKRKLYRTGDLARRLSDGNIEFLGRVDDQVKIRGYRIELGEIENILLKHDNVREAVVICKDDTADKYLFAYLVCKQEFKKEEIQDYLKKLLPDYMIPTFFIELEKIPLTDNGKINRKALPVSFEFNETNFVEPTSELERKLQKIWSEILGLKEEQISICTNFFEIGGNSLKAVSLVARINKEWNVSVPVVDIFEYTTIEKFTSYLQRDILNVEKVQDSELVEQEEMTETYFEDMSDLMSKFD